MLNKKTALAVSLKAVVHLFDQHGVSQRRACDVLEIDRSSVRYRSARPDDAELRRAIKVLAAERRRFGYRRIHLMLKRQGIYMNQKKLLRLYAKKGLRCASVEAGNVL